MYTSGGGEDTETVEDSTGGGIDAILAKVNAGEMLDEEEKKTLAEAVTAKGESTDGGDGVDKATASDNAEARIDDDNTDVNQESLSEVGKALVGLMKKQGVVNKATERDQMFIENMNKVAKAMGALVNRVEKQDAILGDILEGLGISEELIEKESVQKSGQDNEPLNDPKDYEGTLKVLKDLLGSKDEGTKKETPKSRDDVRKELGTAMQTIFSGRNQ
ncbi:MAG: hypothetical protein GF388_06985 [Candidatus Aegiribacteria sp.]|nr:hypothetical protein [Candidatus Aegiribacteria sp.]